MCGYMLSVLNAKTAAADVDQPRGLYTYIIFTLTFPFFGLLGRPAASKFR